MIITHNTNQYLKHHIIKFLRKNMDKDNFFNIGKLSGLFKQYKFSAHYLCMDGHYKYKANKIFSTEILESFQGGSNSCNHQLKTLCMDDHHSQYKPIFQAPS